MIFKVYLAGVISEYILSNNLIVTGENEGK